VANNLPRSKQVAVVAALTEGCSLRSTARMTGVDRETVGTILGRVGLGCLAVLDETMVDLPCTRLELDELWSFVGMIQEGEDLDVAAPHDLAVGRLLLDVSGVEVTRLAAVEVADRVL
jgi:hypothetical protein